MPIWNILQQYNILRLFVICPRRCTLHLRRIYISDNTLHFYYHVCLLTAQALLYLGVVLSIVAYRLHSPSRRVSLQTLHARMRVVHYMNDSAVAYPFQTCSSITTVVCMATTCISNIQNSIPPLHHPVSPHTKVVSHTLTSIPTMMPFFRHTPSETSSFFIQPSSSGSN